MIDLTPLDVRNKHRDFKRILRGYDPQEVDPFLVQVAERMEQLVMENLQLRERSEGLERQVASQSGRERAVQEALVTAQELRADIRSQAEREAELILQEARTEARRLRAEAEAEARTRLRDAERGLERARDALEEMERRRTRFLKAFRQLLEREMDVVEVEEARPPLEERAIDLDLGGGRRSGAGSGEAPADETGGTPADEFLPAEEDGTAPPPLDAPVDELAAAAGMGALVGADLGGEEEPAPPEDEVGEPWGTPDDADGETAAELRDDGASADAPTDPGAASARVLLFPEGLDEDEDEVADEAGAWDESSAPPAEEAPDPGAGKDAASADDETLFLSLEGEEAEPEDDPRWG